MPGNLLLLVVTLSARFLQHPPTKMPLTEDCRPDEQSAEVGGLETKANL